MKLKYLLFLILLQGVLVASSLPKYYTKTLKNGLQMVVIPMKNNSNVISTDIFYKVGSKNEVMGKSGIAHMLEHLNFKSTKNLKAGEFDEIVKGFGGVNNASTGFDFTHYFIKSSSSKLDKSLELFAELMQNLTLKDEEFQPERDVVAEERRWRTDNSPTGYLYFKLFNNLFTYHPYHWTPIGFMNDIQNWTIEDIRDFHSKYYVPNNAVIVVSGDINKDEVFKKIKKYFKNIKPNKNLPQAKTYMQEPIQDGAKRVMLHKDTQVEILAIAYHIPNFANKDQVALSALSEILSSGKSSRLSKLLINDKQMVNSIYGYNMELSDPGVFLFFAICNPGVKAQTVEKEILKEIQKIKKGNITQKELDRVITNTKADFIFSLENSSNVSDLFGSYLARGDIKPLLSYEESIKNLKLEDIKNVANKYLTTNNSTTIILKGKN
jgi:predicted Zn-dependent peptidase